MDFSNKKTILSIGAGLLVIVSLILIFGLKERAAQKVELIFWSVFDASDVYQPLIVDFKKEFPNIDVKYYKKNPQTYEEELVNALAAGRGPDIFSLYHTQIEKHRDKIYPLPAKLLSVKDFKETFVDVASQDLIKNNVIYALPFSVDTLALFYNKDFFNSAGIASPPKTWEEFVEAAPKLTKKDEALNILRSGAAMGGFDNINRASDILALLILQTGEKIIAQDKKTDLGAGAENALAFYTNFTNASSPVYAWNQAMPYSIDAFVEQKTAIMFNYSYHLETVRFRAPHLNFGAALMPQPQKAQKAVNFANYWAQTVSKNSPNPKEAWQFLLWLAKKENLSRYLENSKTPSSRRDLISEQAQNEYLGVFARQALSAASFYQPDQIKVEQVLGEMIRTVIKGESSVREAVRAAKSKLELLVKK